MRGRNASSSRAVWNVSRQEVGKVAKAAPVLISKALELLIGDLVQSASKVCKSKNAATVNVNHLREAVAKENTFDFLQEVSSMRARQVVPKASRCLYIEPYRLRGHHLVLITFQLSRLRFAGRWQICSDK